MLEINNTLLMILGAAILILGAYFVLQTESLVHYYSLLAPAVQGVLVQKVSARCDGVPL